MFFNIEKRAGFFPLALIVILCFTPSISSRGEASEYDRAPPVNQVRLIFVHHSVGENWLGDENGGLGIALHENNYFVSDTNYGWGPDGIGDTTDIGHWWLWFRGPDSATYLDTLYSETEQHSDYTRPSTNPGGENEIIMFKSCFPNSGLSGGPDDPVPPIESNPLRGEACEWPHHTVANAKGIYIDLLEHFQTRPDKLFVVITAPPLHVPYDPDNPSNARAFNRWLVNDLLQDYPLNNVFVFDFFNVLTTNGGDPHTNDLNQEEGNHHRWWNGGIQHKTDGDDDGDPDILEYPTNGDDHPSRAGNLKATAELIPLLNIAYNRFMQSSGRTVEKTTTESPPPLQTEDSESPPSTQITSEPSPTVTERGESFITGDLKGDTTLWGTVIVALIVIVVCAFILYRRKRVPSYTRIGEFKYCINCGEKIVVSAHFCNICGVKQDFE